MIYTATITSASLRLRESRIVAGLLLEHVSPARWQKAVVEQNVLFISVAWDDAHLEDNLTFLADNLSPRKNESSRETLRRYLCDRFFKDPNALAHRDYRAGGSVFVRHYSKSLEIVSPGGFPPGITAENLLWRQAPRNRRVAEVLAKCDLVERSGQGVDRMFEACIRESKALPDFSDSDDHQVSLVLSGEVQDERFLGFLERVGAERLASFTTDDLLVLDAVHRDAPIRDRLRGQLPRLTDLGIIERKGRGRGTTYLLSERFYRFVGKRGAYTRKKGLDKETNKALLQKHLRRNQAEGSPLRELQEVLPALSSGQIQRLLAEMKAAGEVHMGGRTRGARWYPGPAVARGKQP